MPVRTMQRWVIMGAAAAMGALLLACTPETNVTVSPGESTGISVTGTGTVSVMPDIGVLNLGVEVTRGTVADARDAAAGAMDEIFASLRDNDVEDRDVTTRSFNIYPQYRYRENEAPEIVGFTVTNQVEVKVRDIDRVSEVLDEAIAAGGDTVRLNNVSFSVDEPKQYLEQAREEAVADARARAEQLADLAGVSLGDVRTISESVAGGGVPLPRFEAAAGGADTSTPISPGESEITLNVFVVYNVE